MVAGLVRPHPWPFAIAVCGSVLYAAGTVVGAVVVGRLVDEVVLPVLRDDEPVAASTVWWWSAIVVVVAVVRVGGISMRRYFAGMTTERVSRQYRTDLATAYNRLPMSFHRRRSPGDLLAHMDADTEKLTEVLHPLPYSIAVVFMIVFSAIALVVVDPVIALLAALVFPLIVRGNRIYTDKVEAPATAQQHAVGRVATVVHESLDGALVVKLLGRQDDERQRVEAEASTLREHRVRVGNLRAVFEAALDAVPNIGIAAVLLVGAWRVDAGSMTVGDLVQVSALFATLAFPMRVLGFFLENVPPSIAALHRLRSVLDEPALDEPALDEAVFDEPVLDASALGAPVNVGLPEGPLDLELRSVSAGYGDTTTINDVDLAVAAGEVVAIVGATGSGKSTIVAAIAGLVDTEIGAITLGGAPLDGLDPAQRADAVRIVLQEAFLFVDSVDENVSLGRPGVDAPVVAASLEAASAERFVGDLPDGGSTIVGERGLTLSGGQRQRVALARAMAGEPKVLVLDDATSAIDAATERAILDSLRTRAVAPSMLIVAQRLSTIRLADRVVFVRDGRIVATGPHEQLLADDQYRALVTAYEQDN